MKLTNIIQVYKGIIRIEKDMDNIFSFTGSHKIFRIYYRISLEMARSVFSVVGMFLLYLATF